MLQNDLVPEPLLILLKDWQAEAEMLRRRGADSQAGAIESMVEEVQTSYLQYFDEGLPLKQASEESGYTADHLGRQVRNGRIPNAGRRGAPQILRRHLPRKLGQPLAGFSSDVSSKEQIARSVADSG